MQLGAAEPNTKRTRISRAEYLARVRKQPVDGVSVCDALRYLVPLGDRKSILALFENRVTFGAVHHWKKGRRHLPQWARELLTKKLRAEIERRAKIIETL